MNASVCSPAMKPLPQSSGYAWKKIGVSVVTCASRCTALPHCCSGGKPTGVLIVKKRGRAAGPFCTHRVLEGEYYAANHEHVAVPQGLGHAGFQRRVGRSVGEAVLDLFGRP